MALIAAGIVAGCGTPRSEHVQSARPLSPDTLRAWMEAGRQIVLLDTRPDSLHRQRSLPGAFPAAGRTIPELRQVLPMDHTVPIVFYNQDGNAPLAGEDPAREAAERYGFPLVYRLEGGLDRWQALGYPVDGYWTVPDSSRP